MPGCINVPNITIKYMLLCMSMCLNSPSCLCVCVFYWTCHATDHARTRPAQSVHMLHVPLLPLCRISAGEPTFAIRFGLQLTKAPSNQRDAVKTPSNHICVTSRRLSSQRGSRRLLTAHLPRALSQRWSGIVN